MSTQTVPKIAHVVMAHLDYDSRVQRAMETARAGGFGVEVVAFGHPLKPRTFSFAEKAWLAGTFFAGGLFGVAGAKAAYWAQPYHRQALKTLTDTGAELVHAHDWDALPIACAYADSTGARVLYDSHELAAELFPERRLWRMTMPRAIRLLEKYFINSVDEVVTVSEALSKALKNNYSLNETPGIVRNMPSRANAGPPVAPTDQRILHYHGVIARGRGLKRSIEILACLPPCYQLRLVGPERSEGYSKALLSHAQHHQVSDRMTILTPVAPNMVVNTATTGQFGLCLLEEGSSHNAATLPNKLFEYLAAGLTPIVSGSQEMANLCNIAR